VTSLGSNDPSNATDAHRAGAAEDIAAWAVGAGLAGLDQGELTARYCERLVEAGVPLWRASVGADTLHPLIGAQGHRWLAGEGVRAEFFARARTPEGEREWRESPWFRLIESGEGQMRRRLARGEGTGEFPLLAALAAQGGTDYWARIVRFGDGDNLGAVHGLASSWATREARGFTGRDLALIDATLPAFALAFKASIAAGTARTLATTYLGRDAAERILRGEIERGQVRTVPAVLWFSDLTGFTRIADTMPREQLLDLLNAYADCLVGVVHEHGGEVLKFMGDGILAVFSGGRGDACRRALDAAEAARAAIARRNRERAAAGLPVTAFTLALHEGEVLSGNVGSEERLDFTVIGPAVNELIRIQAMSRSLDQPVLVSASFAAACGDQRRRLVSLGRYALRGVGRPQELFILDLAGPAEVDHHA
jgi:adenylate cyclase